MCVCERSKLAKLDFNLTQFTYRDGMSINLSYPFLDKLIK